MISEAIHLYCNLVEISSHGIWTAEKKNLSPVQMQQTSIPFKEKKPNQTKQTGNKNKKPQKNTNQQPYSD